MPLTLLGPMVLIGLALIALALWGLGFTKTTQLTPEAVRAEFLADQGTLPDSVVLTNDRRAALARVGQENFVVWAFGADIAIHSLKGAARRDTRNGILIVFHDFATPRTAISLTQDERDTWERALA